MSELFNIKISSNSKSYSVIVGPDIVQSRLENQPMFRIVDDRLSALFPFTNHEPVVHVSATEDKKTLESVATIIETLRSKGATRNAHIVALGGGIIQDVATFAASSYMRGIPWIYCPTTLLGMVDSCIGGKSSINVGQYKNIAGNFYPPDEIWIDTVFCDTLSSVQKAEGLCEAVKICFAGGEPFNDYLMWVDTYPDYLTDPSALAPIIGIALSTKKRFIEEDEFDNGIRRLLNFGHTFGHAIEGATHYEISHGIAVGLGVIAAIHISVQLGRVSADHPRVQALLNQVQNLLRTVPSLSSTIQELDTHAAMTCFRSDKKHSSTHFAMILLNEAAELEFSQHPRTDAIEALIQTTFGHIKEQT